MYNFRNLIKMYQTDKLYRMKNTFGYNEFGEWVELGDNPEQIFGAVTPVMPSEADHLQHLLGGTINADMRKVYCYEDISKGEVLQFDGLKYTVVKCLDYFEHDKDLRIYYMKRGERV